MSNYNARRGQVSQFIRDLNALNRPETHGDDTFSIENDLALFTNTQFFDFDSGQNTDFQAEPVKGGEVEAHSAAVSEVAGPTVMTGSEMPNMEFMSGKFWLLHPIPLPCAAMCKHRRDHRLEPSGYAGGWIPHIT